MKTRLLLTLLVINSGCTRHDDHVPARVALPAIRVEVAAAQARNVPQLTEISGNVRPIRRAVIAAKLMGAITELPIVIGQQIRSGELLLRIFAADLEARVEQASVQLNMTRRDLKREELLLEKGASTAEGVRNLRDRTATLEAALREARVQLSFAEIRAPFDGVISRRIANLGDLAAPGQPLLEIEGRNAFEIEANIPDSLTADLAVGTTLACDTGQLTFTGAVREISSASDPVTRSIGVKIGVPPGTKVHSGQFIRLLVPHGAASMLLLPASAILVSGQMERVFVVDAGNRAALRLVKTAGSYGATGDKVIIAGLGAGERVVLYPPAGLRDGQPLQILP